MIKSKKVFILALLMLLVGSAWTSSISWAQESSEEASSDATVKSTSSGKVIEFKEIQLEGTVQRPSAAYFMQRKKLKFKGLVPKKSFISEIKKSVSKPPF